MSHSSICDDITSLQPKFHDMCPDFLTKPAFNSCDRKMASLLLSEALYGVSKDMRDTSHGSGRELEIQHILGRSDQALFQQFDAIPNELLNALKMASDRFSLLMSALLTSHEEYMTELTLSSKWRIFTKCFGLICPIFEILEEISLYMRLLICVAILEFKFVSEDINADSEKPPDERMGNSDLLQDSIGAAWHVKKYMYNKGENNFYTHKLLDNALYNTARRRATLPLELYSEDILKEGNTCVTGGGFADVWRGVFRSNFVVALKVPRVMGSSKDISIVNKELCKEAYVWYCLRHPNILPLLGVSRDLFYPLFTLVIPWMENGNLKTFLDRNQDESHKEVFIQDIASGLRYLHTRDPPVTHGDIRCSNILVNERNRGVIADFGLSRVQHVQASLTGESTYGRGSLRWQAPEILFAEKFGGNGKLTPASDVYAFGMTCLEIFTGKNPFHDKTDAQVVSILFQHGLPQAPGNLTIRHHWCALMLDCWSLEDIRPSIADICDRIQFEHCGSMSLSRKL